MPIDTAAPRSRRHLLAAAAGGLAALAAQAFGRPLPARAVDGDYVRVGWARTGTATTSIANTTDDSVVFQATSTAGGIAVVGNSTSYFGVQGVSTSSIGVDGQSDTWYGVRGVSGTQTGVYGYSEAPDEAATVGHNNGESTGVLGFSGIPWTTLPAAPAKTGVYGYAHQDGAARGVWGRSAAGQGVRGQATSGTGGYFTATTGVALQTSGRVRFGGAAGLATIASGSASKVVTPGVPIAADSKVLATMQTSAGGTRTIHRVVRDPAAGHFTIYLTAAATQDCTVAWFVIS